MNREASITLYEQGKDAWNKWANEMLAEKRRLMEAQEWKKETNNWEDRASVIFTTVCFGPEKAADFSEFIFPSQVQFSSIHRHNLSEVIIERTTFQHAAIFNRARFLGNVSFEDAIFEKEAWFREVIFEKEVSFQEVRFQYYSFFEKTNFNNTAIFYHAKFSEDTYFNNTIFSRNAIYTDVRFKAMAHFENVKFKGTAWFAKAQFFENAIFDKAVFSRRAWFSTAVFRGYSVFYKTVFAGFSNFEAIASNNIFALRRTHFVELPDFQQAHFREAPDLNRISIPRANPKTPETAAKYRALKKLAIQAHDHEQEINFFAGELEAKGSFFGKLYGVFSDYGRSLSMPFLAWSVTTLYAMMGYHSLSPLKANNEKIAHSSQTCSKLADAFELALRKGLLALGWEKSSRLDHIYSCLYGRELNAPVIPFAVSMGGLAQTVLSAIFIFLFLLAVRNQFRIK